jgi:hypothetical protein
MMDLFKINKFYRILTLILIIEINIIKKSTRYMKPLVFFTKIFDLNITD